YLAVYQVIAYVRVQSSCHLLKYTTLGSAPQMGTEPESFAASRWKTDTSTQSTNSDVESLFVEY
ncbi:hypothetical protein, partial [Vibrio parahaemolyticus]|uniref:hypothetical protein n=1 Tax=Vibrio parahaemolyticus TaxID=670 RepID=UPI001C5EE6EF